MFVIKCLRFIVRPEFRPGILRNTAGVQSAVFRGNPASRKHAAILSVRRNPAGEIFFVSRINHRYCMYEFHFYHVNPYLLVLKLFSQLQRISAIFHRPKSTFGSATPDTFPKLPEDTKYACVLRLLDSLHPLCR